LGRLEDSLAYETTQNLTLRGRISAVPFTHPMTPEAYEATLDALTERNTERNKSVLALRLDPAATAGPPQCGIDTSSSVEIDSKLRLPGKTPVPRTLRRPVARLEDLSGRDTASRYPSVSDTSPRSDCQEDNDSNISSEYHGVPFGML